ncbi:lipolytic enzyme / transcription regulator protein [Legionella santicrucis]|uniref:Lipolytic enzyme / transcription regulator protein n=1 Tax=Legionella santicrucis TaxID=45074 RepID=A0A0W0YA13_9GAMM|nr:helix-turn-helix transcriptional regulator [Legionella santicrucis]KTD53444.1 lipolytic enzyme / transcription regulator protein [Legionella santicrucis]
MHSLDENGNICVNLNDYNELSESIRFRDKIDHLVKKLDCPKDISNFSIAMFFKNNQRYYLSNMYLWAIPYRTEGLYRGDIDHDYDLYDGKEFFIQREIKYDEMQIPIIQILEERYKLSTTFAMVRQCDECDFIIEVYNTEKIADPYKFYFQVRDQFEQFISQFIDSMILEITTALPKQKWLKILTDNTYRKKVLTRKATSAYTVQLSQREHHCLSLISQGMSVKQIADHLHLSNETVNTHAKSIRSKLDCYNITEAVSKALRAGLL